MKRNAKKISTWLMIMMIVIGCVDEGGFEREGQTNNMKNSIITLNATMPEEASTRLMLERDDLDVTLKWKEDDQLHLCIVYAMGIEQQVADIKNISPDGKNAEFDIVLPTGDYTEFDLYGVYGGGGLSDTEKSKALLPTKVTASELSDLTDVLVLKFESKKVSVTNPDISIALEHLGSLFNVSINNMSEIGLNNVQKVQLTANLSIDAHLNEGAATYDLVTGEFSGTNTSSKQLVFDLDAATSIAAGGSLDFWGWFIPVEDEKWPAMKLELLDAGDNVLATTRSSKPMRTSPTLPGKAFYIEANWDGMALNYTGDVLENVITFTHSMVAGSTVRLALSADAGEEVWIDLNNNGVKDDGEEVTSFGTTYKTYLATTQTVSVHGKLTEFRAAENSITDIDFSNAYPGVKIVVINNNQISEVDLHSLEELNSLTIRQNPLTELDLSNNSNIREIYANSCRLKSVTMPTYYRPGVLTGRLRFHTNQLSAAAITSLIDQLPEYAGSAANMELSLWNRISPDGNEVRLAHFAAALAKKWEIRALYNASQHPDKLEPGDYGPDPDF